MKKEGQVQPSTNANIPESQTENHLDINLGVRIENKIVENKNQLLKSEVAFPEQDLKCLNQSYLKQNQRQATETMPLFNTDFIIKD